MLVLREFGWPGRQTAELICKVIFGDTIWFATLYRFRCERRLILKNGLLVSGNDVNHNHAEATIR